MLEIRHRFPAHAASAAAARRAVEGLLAASSPANVDDARIVVSELVTYSILNSSRDHTSWIDLTLKVSRKSLRIEIQNGGSGSGSASGSGDSPIPVTKEEALSEPSRSIVEGLAEDWGTASSTGIWAVMAWDRGEGGSRQFDAYRSISLRSLSLRS
jgi:hypothetical protein